MRIVIDTGVPDLRWWSWLEVNHSLSIGYNGNAAEGALC